MGNENVKLRGSSTVPWCSYVNNLILFMLYIFSLQRATTILNELFTNYGHCVNILKTETMILNHALLEDEYPDTIISLCNVPLLKPTAFKYLGSDISQNELHPKDIEINHCIKITYARFAAIANLLQNSKIHLKTKAKFLNSFVCSRLTYLCQNWNLTVGQFEKLNITHGNLLRRMIRGGFKCIGNNDGDYRYELNNEKFQFM